MDILNKINELRNLTDLIKSKEIDNNGLADSVKKIYPSEYFLNSIEDIDLKNLYFDSLQILASTIYNFLFDKSISEELLQLLLKVVNDPNSKRNIYEQLLEIKKNESNPFNDLEYVNRFNDGINKLCWDLGNNLLMERINSTNYHPSVRDGVRNVEIYALIKEFEHKLTELFSEGNIRLITESKNDLLKISIVQNLINNFNSTSLHWRVRVTREFEKVFFTNLQKIGIEDKILEGKINERIYGIDFDTKGLINKFEKLKKKIFKK